jgi:hypothetical protein
LFVKTSPEKEIAILIVYVDDIILSGDYKEELVRLKKLLAKEFEIKDLGYLKYFLGMEVARSRKGIYVSQRKCLGFAKRNRNAWMQTCRHSNGFNKEDRSRK